VNHWPSVQVCEGCGRTWPCPDYEKQEARWLVSLAIERGTAVFVHRNGGVFVGDGRGAELPLPDEQVQAALRAVGWRLTATGMEYSIP
jgi:hypothetical protein